MPIHVLEELPGCRLGAFDSMLISVWYGELSILALDRLTAQHQALCAKHGKITFLSVVVNATGSPPAHVREHMKKTTPEMVNLRRGNFVVVLAKGMAGVIARTFLAGLSLISSENMRVFSSMNEAVDAVKNLDGQSILLKSNPNLLDEVQTFVAMPVPIVAQEKIA